MNPATIVLDANVVGSSGARTLLDAGAEIDRKDRSGNTAVFWSALRGHTETVDLLLTRGADVNSVSANGATPLMVAAAAGHGETVAALLSAGTDPSMEDREGRTALRWAQRRGHEDVAERLHGMDRSNWGK